MTYLKIIQYVYLAFGFIFLYKAYEEYTNGRNPIMFLAIGIVAIAMFFFRRHFHKKQENRKNK